MTAPDVLAAAQPVAELFERLGVRQWGDIVGVIRVAGAALDRDYLTRWAADLAVSDLLERALADAQAAG